MEAKRTYGGVREELVQLFWNVVRLKSGMDAMPDGVPSFHPDLLPCLHVGLDAFEDIVAVHELRCLLDLHGQVGAAIDILLVVRVHEPARG